MKNYQIRLKNWIFVFLYFISLCFNASLFSQMTVINTLPIDGSVNIPANETISFTFSLPLDTSDAFEFNGYPFYLEMELFPLNKWNEPMSITLSADRKTVMLNDLQLESNEKYTLILCGAKSTTGELLEKPIALSFFTYTNFNPITVSGKISFSGNDPTHTVVKLLDLVDNSLQTVAATVVNSSNGDFTIPNVLPGDYSCIAILDVNHDGKLQPESGDMFGIYDLDSNWEPDNIIVDLQSIGGINFDIGIVPEYSAHLPLEVLIPAMTTYAPNHKLFSVESKFVNTYGNAPTWNYAYISPQSGSAFFYTSIGYCLFLEQVYVSPVIPELIPDDYWCNSTRILPVADAQGGFGFRTKYSNWKIEMLLGTSQILGFSGYLGKTVEPTQITSALSKMNKMQKENSLLNSTGTYWFVNFVSDSAKKALTFYFDAQTGDFLPPQPSKSYLAAITAEAKTKAADAKLNQCTAWEFNENGISQIWSYHFISESQKKKYLYWVNGPYIKLADENTFIDDGYQLSDTWIDCDEAFRIAENNGGQGFRSSYPDYMLFATLNGDPRFLYPGGPRKSSNTTYTPQQEENVKQYNHTSSFNQAFWFFTYWSENEQKELLIAVDAVNQKIMAPTTAKETEGVARLEALKWSADVQLTGILNATEPMDTDGRSEEWFYNFYSPLKDSILSIITYNGGLSSQSVSLSTLTLKEISDTWLDSDEILQNANSQGGNTFIASQDSVKIYTQLCTSPVSQVSSVLYWIVNYIGNKDDLNIYLNAETGQLLSQVNADKRKNTIPKSMELLQNYPNPFNPETTIQYSIPNKEHVTLRVLNLEGKLVITLEDKIKNPGVYQIHWNGKDKNQNLLSSGIYIYELQAGIERHSGKMMLVR